MKIAVTYENGQIFQHFGKTEKFKLYLTENGKITEEKILNAEGSGHGALAMMLGKEGVDALICGGIGGGAQVALKELNIEVYGGASGDADAAVNDLLNGDLRYNPEVKCSHHEAEHGETPHACGEHGCGKGDCGR